MYNMVVLHGTVRGWSWDHMEVFGRFERGWGGIERSWRYLIGAKNSWGSQKSVQVFGKSRKFWKFPGMSKGSTSFRRYLEGSGGTNGMQTRCWGYHSSFSSLDISIHYRSRYLYSSDSLLCASLKNILKPTWLEFKINLQNQAVSTKKGAPFADHLAGTRTLSNNRQVRWPSSWHDKQHDTLEYESAATLLDTTGTKRHRNLLTTESLKLDIQKNEWAARSSTIPIFGWPISRLSSHAVPAADSHSHLCQFQANLQAMFSDPAFIMQQMLTTELLNSAWANTAGTDRGASGRSAKQLICYYYYW